MKLTLVIKKKKNGYLIGQIKEFPKVITQGITIEELRENITDALEIYLEDIREGYQPDGEIVLEEEIVISGGPLFSETVKFPVGKLYG